MGVTVLTETRWPPMVEISCDGCHRRAASDLTSPELRRLIGWTDEDGRDWCILCQRLHRSGRHSLAYRRTH